MGDFSGGGSDKSSSSSSTNTTTTTNIDRRQVMSDGAIGITSDGSTVNIQSMDAGIVKAALDVVAGADATNGNGFNALLNLADHLFTGAGSLLEKTQQTTLAQVGQVSTAQNNAKGAVDQKTIMVLAGVAGAVAVAIAIGKK